MQPTQEQQDAVDIFATGEDLAIHAGAGTGKTSTLRLIAESAAGRRGLYLVFNKSAQMDARRRFAGTGVTPKTIHSLAYASYGDQARLNQKFLFWPQKAAVIGADTKFAIGGSYITRQTLVRLAEETVTAFCRTMDREITADLVVLPATIAGSSAERQKLRVKVAELAQRYWADWMSPNGTIAHRHDTYLKRWALSDPELDCDYLLVDEAQDLEPLTVGIVNAQSMQRVAVGDPNQQIYEWRGAQNALDQFPGRRTLLSQSFRFGDAIAGEANFWLELLGSDMRLVGNGGDSSVWPSKREPEAVLTRTNGGAMREILESQNKGLTVGVAGERKVKELTDLARAALDLQTKGSTNHRELDVFDSWSAVVAFVKEERSESDISALVDVVESYGAATVLRAIERTVPPAQAQQVISTAHVAKGLEWFHVRISDDFREPKTDAKTGRQKPLPAEEARLAYVAVTRAQRHLDPSGLAWARTMTGGVEGVARASVAA